MVMLEKFLVRVNVALSPEEWHQVLNHLVTDPHLERLILEQLVDAIGEEYSAQLEGTLVDSLAG